MVVRLLRGPCGLILVSIRHDEGETPEKFFTKCEKALKKAKDLGNNPPDPVHFGMKIYNRLRLKAAEKTAIRLLCGGNYTLDTIKNAYNTAIKEQTEVTKSANYGDKGRGRSPGGRKPKGKGKRDRSSSKSHIQCHKCGKYGHFQDECRSRSASKGRGRKGKGKKGKGKGKRGTRKGKGKGSSCNKTF